MFSAPVVVIFASTTVESQRSVIKAEITTLRHLRHTEHDDGNNVKVLYAAKPTGKSGGRLPSLPQQAINSGHSGTKHKQRTEEEPHLSSNSLSQSGQVVALPLLAKSGCRSTATRNPGHDPAPIVSPQPSATKHPPTAAAGVPTGDSLTRTAGLQLSVQPLVRKEILPPIPSSTTQSTSGSESQSRQSSDFVDNLVGGNSKPKANGQDGSRSTSCSAGDSTTHSLYESACSHLSLQDSDVSISYTATTPFDTAPGLAGSESGPPDACLETAAADQPVLTCLDDTFTPRNADEGSLSSLPVTGESSVHTCSDRFVADVIVMFWQGMCLLPTYSQ